MLWGAAIIERIFMPEFPHLKDTTFPNLSTVDVYRFQNTFDYTRWNEDTIVRLVNVIWNSDYSDVVKFDNDSKRDSYFDSLEDSYTMQLTQAARILPENYVKLPIPFDVMARYNYLYIDMPIATSKDTPLDYETANGIRRWYFFIENVSYLSPNSTQVFLTLDVWTNFINDVEINYMMLERGHAPVSASDTNEYLQNPIGNNRYLLAPDVNFDNAGITRSSNYIPFGNGTKYVCIASTCAPEQIVTLGEVVEDSSFDPFTGQITYSDIPTRYGHQLQVNGFTMGTGKDFSTARTPAKVGTSDNGLIPNNLSVYAIRADECYGNGTFFADVLQKCPQFLNTVSACFVVDENCIVLGTSYAIAGHTVRRCVGTKRNLFTKQLSKTDFKYPAELQRFAKLYTSPYAVLECTDNDGTTFTINIEETSTVQVKSVVSVAFPFIDYRVFLEGIGGVGSSSYSWRDLRNDTHNLEISNSDWFKYCFDWEIPTFALYMDGETAYQLDAFNRNIKNALRNALVAYHNSMRSANTAMENAIDSADAALENVMDSTQTALGNANRSADTGKTNADNSADTGKTNADNSAATAKTNSDDSSDTMYTNVDETCKTEDANRIIKLGSDLQSVLTANEFNLNIANRSVDLGEAAWHLDMAVAADALAIEAEAMTTLLGSTAMVNMGKGISQGAMSAVSMGMVDPVSMTGMAAVGAVNSGADAYLSAQNQSVALTTRSEIWDSQEAHGQEKWDINRSLAQETAEGQNNVNVDQLNIAGNALARQMDNNHDLARGNAGRTRDMQKRNSQRAKDTANTNAENTQNMLKTNASNTQSTSKANALDTFNNDRNNAQRTHDTAVDNSGYTRQVSELNAKELLENAANGGMASLLDARNNKPTQIGESTGSASADYMQTRGIQIKVKTQSDSAIRQTGDIFARYGYTLNQAWNVAKTGLCLMRNFTYWKSSDIWVDDRKSSTNLVNTIITRIFNNGVTVWNNPDKIGRVSVYDN